MTTTPNFTDGTWLIAGTIHFAGDPNGDILWQNIANQSLILWQQSGATTTAVSTLPSLPGFDAALVGDFDKDGIGDVLLRNAGTLQNKLYLSTTGTLKNVFNSTWTPSATTDLTNDGSDEIIWVNPTSTLMNSWVMDSGNPVNQPAFSTGYANGDSLLSAFEGTGTQSFKSLWFDVSANQFNVASYTGGVRTITDTFTVDAGNLFVNGGDFNGDGGRDFLFIDDTGTDAGSAEIVFTNNVNETGRVNYAAPTFLGFGFETSGDFDNDGFTELLARDYVTGELTTYQVIGGTASSQTLQGGDTNDLIDGGSGFDQIFAKGGDDIILGGDDDDFVLAGDGDDRINGGLGDDSLLGGNGNDEIDAGIGNDALIGGAGDDTLRGGNDTDVMFGGEGDDFLRSGSFGFDHMSGGPGNDVFQAFGDRVLQEGNDGDDVLFGGTSLDVLFGGNGNDLLVGGLSSDTVFGGSGDDIIFGVDRNGDSDTNDTLFGGSGTDYFYLGNENTRFYLGTEFATISDFSTSTTLGDWLMLEGTASSYTFFDTGPTIEVRQTSDADVLAVVETTATAAAVAAKAIYLG